MLEVIARKNIPRQEWNEAVSEFPGAWFWHLYDVPAALATWHGRSDLSFAILDRGTVVAIVPLLGVEIRKLGPIFLSRLESLGGVVCNAESDPKSVLEVALRETLRIGKEHDAMYADFSLSPMAPAHRANVRSPNHPMLSPNCADTSTQAWVVDLRRENTELWGAINRRTRDYIKRAENMGVVVEEAGSREDLIRYYDLHCQTYSRTGATPHPFSYFEMIWERFVARGLATVLFAVRDSRVEAALNVAFYKNAGVYWTGASSHEAQGLRANHLLQWEAMKWLKASGAECYETGEANFDLATKQRGISDFKQKFGGELRPLYRCRFPLSASLRRRVHATYLRLKRN